MDNLNAREVFRKYNHTYSLIRDKTTKEVRPVYFQDFGFNEHDVPFTVVELFHKSGKKVSVNVELNSIDILPVPNRKMFNFNGSALLYSRSPNRQWRKGISTDNSTIVDISDNLLDDVVSTGSVERVVSRQRLYTLDVMSKLLLSEYENDATKALMKVADVSDPTISIAVSDVYWVTSYSSLETPVMLYRYDVPIALYNKSDTFTLVDKIYLQEVTDFCKRFNLTTKIEV